MGMDIWQFENRQKSKFTRKCGVLSLFTNMVTCLPSQNRSYNVLYFSTLSRWVCVPGTLLIFMCSIINLQGVGTVVSGTCMQGVIHVNDVLLMGPTSLGEFIPVSIRGVHRKRLPVREVRGGQTASFALKKVKYFMGKSVLTSIQATHCRQSDFPPPTWLSLLPRGFPYSHMAWEWG